MSADKVRLIGSAILLIALAVEGSLGQTPRNQQQAGKTSPAQQPTGNQQQVGAPFYSIKDGKTSARRIQLQQQQQPALAKIKQTGEQQLDGSSGEQTNSNDFGASSTASSAPADTDASFTTMLSPTGQSPATGSSGIPNRPQVDQVGSLAQSNLPDSTFADSAPKKLDAAGQEQSSGQQEVISQREMNIGSFNQLLEQAALDDFMSSGVGQQQQVANRSNEQAGVGEPTQQTSLSGDFQPTTVGSAATSSAPGSESGSTSQQRVDSSSVPESDLAGNNNQVPFQFTTATGATSSISMSLDGMMVNSRPRASVNSVSSASDSLWATSASKKAANNPARPAARLGDLQGFVANPDSLNQNQAVKASRRVPFTGVPFSSPASKGQRTRPKASNQVGLTGGQTSTGSTFEVMTAAQLNADNPEQQRNQAPVRQVNGNQMRLPDSFSDQSSSDFGVDEPVKVDDSGRQQLDSNSVELMKSLLGSAGMQGGQLESDFTKASNVNGNPNDDMLMSVVSSADGKERRLVMIARDTLDALQRYAATMQGGQQSATKGAQRQPARKQPARQQQQQQQQVVAGLAGPQGKQQGGNWWPNNQNNRNNQNSFSNNPVAQQQQQPQQQQWQQVASQQQEGVRVQTTTASSLILGGSTTTQQVPAGSSSVSPQVSTFTQESVQADGNSSQVPSGDTFREVPVSSIGADNQRADVQVKRPQQQVRGSQSGGVKLAGIQSKPQTINSSGSTGGGKSAAGGEQQSQAKATSAFSDGGEQSKQKVTNKQSSGSSGGGQKSGSTKNAAANGKAAKKSGPAGNKQASAGKQQRLEGGGKAAGKTGGKQSPKSGANKAPFSSGSTVVGTNGQQQPAAGRLFAGAADSQVVDQSAKAATNEATSDSEPSSTMKPRSAKDGATASSSARKDGQPQVADEQVTTTTASVNIRGRPVATETSFDRQMDELERAQMTDNMGAPLGSTGSTSSSRQGAQKPASQSSQSLSAADQLDNLRAAIPGEPQLDYPIYATPPRTAFDCRAQSCPAGYYADTDAQCQVFHVCQNDGRSDTFLCPNGTIFSQQHFVCVWWWQVDCQQSASFYKLNDNIYCNSAFPGSSSQAQSSGLNPTGGAQLMLASGFGSPNKTTDGPSGAPTSTTDGDLAGTADNQPASNSDPQDTPSLSSSGAQRPDGSGNQVQGGSSESPSGSGGFGGAQQQADVDINQQQQQQQQQLELLAKRA